MPMNWRLFRNRRALVGVIHVILPSCSGVCRAAPSQATRAKPPNPTALTMFRFIDFLLLQFESQCSSPGASVPSDHLDTEMMNVVIGSGES
jgi:hypothetical protein